MAFGSLLVVLAVFIGHALATFGVIGAAEVYQVDTGGGLTFEVNKWVYLILEFGLWERLIVLRRNNGDITSLLYRGTQYQATEKGTQINSGLG
jgi:hypothetical protein